MKYIFLFFNYLKQFLNLSIFLTPRKSFHIPAPHFPISFLTFFLKKWTNLLYNYKSAKTKQATSEKKNISNCKQIKVYKTVESFICLSIKTEYDACPGVVYIPSVTLLERTYFLSSKRYIQHFSQPLFLLLIFHPSFYSSIHPSIHPSIHWFWIINFEFIFAFFASL